MAIDSYAQNRDAELAKKRYTDLGSNAADVLNGDGCSRIAEYRDILAFMHGAGGAEVATRGGTGRNAWREEAGSSILTMRRWPLPGVSVIAGGAFYCHLASTSVAAEPTPPCKPGSCAPG